MAKAINKVDVYARGTILATIGGIYEAKAVTIPKDDGLSVTIGGRKIVLAGTVWPANDGTAEGLVYSDVDVTDGDQEVAIVYSGTVSAFKLPVVPAAAALAAMKNITLLPSSAAGYTFNLVLLSAALTAVTDATAVGKTVRLGLSAGATFSAAATTKTNWTLAESGAALQIDTITLSADREYADIVFKGTFTTGDITILAGATTTAFATATDALKIGTISAT